MNFLKDLINEYKTLYEQANQANDEKIYIQKQKELELLGEKIKLMQIRGSHILEEGVIL